MPPRFPPFTSAEKTSILIGLTLAVLVAIWNIVRGVRERTALKRYGWIGSAILLLLFAVEAVAAVRESPFFTQNPQRLVILPITGAAVLACLFVVFRFSAERNVRSAPKAFSKEETAQSRVFLTGSAVIYSAILAILLPGMLFSLYGQLFGPQGFWIFGIAGFLLAMAVFFLARRPLGVRFLRSYPNGLSGPFTSLQNLKAPLRRAMTFAAACAAMGIVTLAVTARLDGVPGTPVFAAREHYILFNHGVTTEVSRLRYCLAGAGFHIAWHGGAAYAILMALHALVFGYVPNDKNSRPIGL